jgi:hypothetical protein
MVRKRPLTTTREKIKGQRARTVHSAHGLAPARKRSFLSGKEYFLDRCPLMGANAHLNIGREVDDY